MGHHTDARIPLLLDGAAGGDFRWTVYYEPEGQGDPSVAALQADLQYIRDTFATHPNFLRVGGRLVVFVWADPADACGMADRWAQANTADIDAYLVLKVFSGYAACTAQPDGWHQHGPAAATSEIGTSAFTISPGFWLSGEAARLERDLPRWQGNVQEMIASGADWQLITSFNEWGEGTSVESAVEWASASGHSDYLDVLHDNGAAPSPPGDPPPVTTLTLAPSDDAEVRLSHPDRNYGAERLLRVDERSLRQTLLRFDVAGIGAASVDSVRLRLFTTNGSPTGGAVFRTTSAAWSEDTVTWNTAPAADGAALGALGAVVAGSWVELDLTGLVTGDAPVSLRLTSMDPNAAAYASTENPNGFAPQLVIVFAAPADGTPPTAPGNLQATDVQATVVSLSWDAATDPGGSGVVGYEIDRPDGALLASLGLVTSYADTTVDPETAYTYVVRARDAAGNVSTASVALAVTTPARGTSAPFVVSRDGTTLTYHADSAISSYSGSLKSVVESAAIELNGLGGGTIAFEAGDFDLGGDWFEFYDLLDITFSGQGIDVTVLRNVASDSTDTEPFDFTRSDRITIRDLTISAGGPPRSTSDVIGFDGGDDNLIDRVKITSSRGRGIIFDGKDAGQTADRNVVRDCIITGVPGAGTELLASRTNRIEGCQISDVGDVGIKVNRSSSVAD